MSLSDEMLAAGEKLPKLRSRLRSIAIESGAAAAFLVDEDGEPFATVGHVEFQLPYPLAGLFLEKEGHRLLSALVGESPNRSDAESRYAVEPVGARALLVVVAEAPLDAGARAVVRSRVKELAALIGPPVDEQPRG